jgi:hypothetical protein
MPTALSRKLTLLVRVANEFGSQTGAAKVDLTTQTDVQRRSVRRCGLARPAAGEQAAWLVAVPDRDGERPAGRARHTNMHAGRKLLAPGNAHEDLPDSFPPERYLSRCLPGAA